MDEVMTKLKLQKCGDTVVGTPGLIKGISGGERKRTNVAISLLGRPSLLLLDEPTSGLDSKMSDDLMADLCDVAKQGCTVIATIHQPSDAVFARFTKVLLLNAGCVAYFGPVTALREVLASCGFEIPKHMHVPLPELLLDALEDRKDDATAAAAHKDRLNTLRSKSIGAKSQGEAADGSSLRAVKRLGFGKQLAVLFKRNMLTLRRSKILTRVRLAQTILATLGVSWIFKDTGSHMDGVNNKLFGLFLVAFAQFLFALLGVVNTFPAERAVFLREAQDQWYHPAAFYIAKVFVDTIMQSLFPIIVVAIAYPLIGLNTSSVERILYFYVFVALLGNCGAAIGFSVSAAVASVSTALSIAPGLMMPQLLLCGLFIKVENLPQPFNALSYLALLKYGLQALVTNEFSCPTDPKCTRASFGMVSGIGCVSSPCDFCCKHDEVAGSGGVCPILTCDDALRQFGMDSEDIWPSGDTKNETIMYNMLFIIGLLVLFRLHGLMMLLLSYRRAKKSG